jgi:hypothetical protein
MNLVTELTTKRKENSFVCHEKLYVRENWRQVIFVSAANVWIIPPTFMGF